MGIHTCNKQSKLLNKLDEPQAALLAYQSTPIENVDSPAETLMGRKLRTTLPILPESSFQNYLTYSTVSQIRANEIENMKRQTSDYN